MALMDLEGDDGPDIYEFIEEILRQTDDDWAMARLGAGAFENLLGPIYGRPDAVERLRAFAQTYPGAREALANVWLSEGDSKEAFALVEHYQRLLYPRPEEAVKRKPPPSPRGKGGGKRNRR